MIKVGRVESVGPTSHSGKGVVLSKRARTTLKRLTAIGLLIIPIFLGMGGTANASGSQCGVAPGPGTWNRICVDVVGTGNYVERVRVRYSATSAPYFPAGFCPVTSRIWGKDGGGVHYERQGGPVCALGAAWWTFEVRDYMSYEPFWMCGEVTYNQARSNPTCVEVRV